MLVSDKEIFFFYQNGEGFVLDPASQMFWSISDDLIRNPHILENNYTRLFSFGFFNRNNQTENQYNSTHFDLSNLVINPSNLCNLDCWFCYSNQNRKTNAEKLNLSEIKSTIKKALEFKIQTQSSTPLSISMFFTSEITLDFVTFLDIWKFIEDIKSNCNFPIHMFLPPTNLMDFNDDFVEFVDKYGYLTVSLDFQNEFQLKKVIQNLSCFKKTVTKHCIIPLNANHKALLKIYSKLLNHFDYVSLRPVRIPLDSKYPWTKKSLELFCEEMQKFVCNLFELPDNDLLQMLLSLGSSDYFVRYLDRIISRAKLTERCPAGRSAVAFNSDSKLYPCSGIIENEQYSFKTFDELGNDDIDRIFTRNLFSKPECKECSIRFYCGGPCEDWKSKLNISSIESVNQIECDINYIYFKNAIYLVSKLYEKNPETLTNYAKEKGIENRLSYPLKFDDFVLFFS